ncbi:hypothetical protein ABW20_dc0102045 [Dactylellina cionopaga]|nr:hypothetical protein ABW20_dc0102045 [Dactylellina cionopaga]
MDSDPILYGDGPENKLNEAVKSIHEGEPNPKRPRLSLEDHHDGQESTRGSPTKSASPIAITEPQTESLVANPRPLATDNPFDEKPSNSGIPGLFLVAGNPVDSGSVEKSSTGETSDDMEGVSRDAEDHEMLALTKADGSQSGSIGGINEQGVITEANNDLDDKEEVGPEIPSYSDEPRNAENDFGIIHDMDDFLEKGKANLGNPGAEWQLDSSADEDDDDTNNNNPRHSSSQSSSDIDTSSTSSDSDEEGEASVDDEEEGEDDAVFLDIQKEAKRLMDEDGGSDDEGGSGFKKGMSGPYKTKNEVTETPLVSTRPNIVIGPSTPIVFLGLIDSIVNDLILVKATVSGEYQVLNEQSLLCFEDRSMLGPVQETFGRVEQPFYTVRLRDAEEVKSSGATLGRRVHYIPSHSTFLFTKTIRAMKGSDASNLHDEEVGDDEREFSDDEAEAEFKRRQKEERKSKGANRTQGQPQPQPPDVIDEPYVPLSRPANLHEMSAPPSQTHPPQRRENIPQRMPPRDHHHQANRGGFRGRGRGRAGRPQPQGRSDTRYSPRRQYQNTDHHRAVGRDERPPVPIPEPRLTSNQQSVEPTPKPPPQVPQPGQSFPAFLPFLPPGQVIPPNFPSGGHINPAFFPIPPNPQLPLPGQFGQFPPPPPLPINPAQFPLLPQSAPPSIEELLRILRSQGHNI